MQDPPKKPRKALATYSPQKLAQWMNSALHRVDNAGMPGSVASNRPADRCLKDLIRRLREDFPERCWIAPSGVEWKGSELPPEVLNAAISRNQTTFFRGNILNMAVELLGNDENRFRWLLASGFDPTIYSQETTNTPIGGLAMRARYKALRACREAGFDLRLPISKKHLEHIPKARHDLLLGSNLLHRVVAHAVRMKDAPSAARTVRELLLAGLDPRETNAKGKTAFDLATGPAVAVLDKWLAHHQASALEGSTAPSKSTSSALRL